jgi:cyclophilin family peptidyl-prolyl cis-trans isomerase
MKPILFVVLALLALAAAPLAADREAQTNVRVEVEGRGDFVIRLDGDKAPKTVAHILKLVRSGFYDGQRFHKVDKSPKPFLVQIGDPASKGGDLSGNGGSGESIPLEDSRLPNVAGAVGLGHPVDKPDKGDSQFYVLLDNASFLDGKYTVFGKVVSGMDVIKKLERGDKVTRMSIVP